MSHDSASLYSRQAKAAQGSNLRGAFVKKLRPNMVHVFTFTCDHSPCDLFSNFSLESVVDAMELHRVQSSNIFGRLQLV